MNVVKAGVGGMSWNWARLKIVPNPINKNHNIAP